MRHVARKHAQQWAQLAEDLCIRAGHDRQGARLGRCARARHRRIYEACAAALQIPAPAGASIPPAKCRGRPRSARGARLRAARRQRAPAPRRLHPKAGKETQYPPARPPLSPSRRRARLAQPAARAAPHRDRKRIRLRRRFSARLRQMGSPITPSPMKPSPPGALLMAALPRRQNGCGRIRRQPCEYLAFFGFSFHENSYAP